MSKPIEEHRKDVLADRESVECCFKLDANACEGVMSLDVAWHIITNFSRVFSGEGWSEAFPNGFDQNLLTMEHLQRGGVICCDPCKKVMERIAAEAGKHKPAFAILKSTVNERANGRLQQETAKEQAEAEQQRKRALALLDRFQCAGNGRILKKTAHNGCLAAATVA